LTTTARRLVALPDLTFNPIPGCNHARNGWLVPTANRH
jgi:hypothetical protein